jgi:hypothetical protein
MMAGRSEKRWRSRRAATYTAWTASTIAPYGIDASVASMATLQKSQRLQPPSDTACRSARNESALVKRKRLYIRP